MSNPGMPNHTETLLTTDRFRVQRHHYQSRGAAVARETIEHPGSVAILPLVDRDHLCLIKSFRIALGGTLIELPAGTLEPGEDPAACARRELAEETGYRCTHLEKLHTMYMSPGILRERMEIFVASDLTPGRQQLEAAEQIETQIVTWGEALAMIQDGSIVDAKTIAALLLYEKRR